MALKNACIKFKTNNKTHAISFILLLIIYPYEAIVNC